VKRILYFDAPAGVSGDMFVGALLDLGASLDVVRGHVAALGVEGMELRVRKVSRRGIAGTKFDVLDPASGRPVDEPGGHEHAGHGHHEHGHHEHGHHEHGHHEHGHEHGRAHDHDPDHRHAHDPGHGREDGHPRRGLREITRLVRESGIPPRVADDALAVFELLAVAEGKVHGVSPEEVHFHEVGALDSIADVVAAASAFHQVAPDEAWCSPVHVGSGTVRCAHGVLPVPAPATLELLKGIPAYSDGTRGELATPTGVALLRHFCTGFSAMPALVVHAVGYGAGSKDFGMPSLFRALVGVTTAGKIATLSSAASG
jgi:uncharacterized protein (DUF111 family)